MSAETLRKAAALMRERAEATDTSGAWDVGRRYARGVDWIRPVYDEDGTVCEIHEGDAINAPDSCEELAQHIASWHPAVALAVADWLDSMTARAEVKIARGGGEAAVWSNERHALAVARAYLGEAS